MIRKKEESIYEALLKRLFIFDETEHFYDLDSDLIDDMARSILTDRVGEGYIGFLLDCEENIEGRSHYFFGYYPPQLGKINVYSHNAYNLVDSFREENFSVKSVWVISSNRTVAKLAIEQDE